MKRRSDTRQFVCNNKFEAIDEENRDKKTKQDRTNSERFVCDGDASAFCGGFEEERGRDWRLVRRHRRIQDGLNPVAILHHVRLPASGRPCHSHWWLTVVLQKQ